MCVDFSDFWPGFDKHDNCFVDLLSRRYELQVQPSPDLLIYSCYGSDFRHYNCRRVLIMWENRGWGFSDCDYAFTCDRIDHPDHYRLPPWAWRLGETDTSPPVAVDISKRGFASVVVSNGTGRTRNRFVERLRAYKPVASGGRFKNNVGGPVSDKLAFISQYKFNVAFENSTYPGYSTEKLLQAMLAATVPIYWGDPHVGRDFNTARFINVHDFASTDAVIDKIRQLDEDDDAYAAMLAETWFIGGEVPRWATPDAILDRFDQFLADRRIPVAQRQRSPPCSVDD